MKTGVPKGIGRNDDYPREGARATARRSGSSHAEWLSDTIAKHVAASRNAPDRRPDDGNDTDTEINEDTVCAAVERLAGRIRAMDANSRAAFTGLQDRLDEISERLGMVAGASRQNTDLTRSLRGVAAMVDDLSRDIDNVDEKARSTVEGQQTSATLGEKNAPEEGMDRVADAIRGLDARISSMSEQIKIPKAEEGPASLDSIKARLDALLMSTPEPWGRGRIGGERQARSPESFTEKTDSRSVRLMSTAPNASAATKPTRRADPVEERIAEIAREIAVRRNGGEMSSAVAEISARQRSIDTQADFTAISHEQERVSKSLALLLAEIGALVGRLDDLQSTAGESARSFCDVKAGLAEIQRNIAERSSAGIDRLELRIGELANRFDSLMQSRREGSAPIELQAQVAELSEELESTRPLEEKSKRIEGDQKKIHVMASEFDQQSQATLGAVDESLADVIGRLARLEREDEAESAALQEVDKATGTYGFSAPLQRPHANSPAGERLASAQEAGEKDSVPSVDSKPHLAALRELAQSPAPGPREESADRMADFIAAARRAAKGTVGEAKGAEGRKSARRSGAIARVTDVLRNRRVAFGLAAAVLVLGIAATQLIGSEDAAIRDTADSDGPAADLARVEPAPKLPPADTASVQPMQSVPHVAKASLPAPLNNNSSAIAFATPEAVDSRFSEGRSAPSVMRFVRTARLETPAIDAAIGPARLRVAATAGDPNAALEIAARYAQGEHVSRDLAKSAAWYERAAVAGIAVAQYRLASLYERGKGVGEDRVAAARWYERAAEQGNIGAMHNLAVMASDGIGGKPDHELAVEWFRKAGRHGVKDSQYNLGVIYAGGLGPAKDRVESYKWFALAAKKGDADAAARRDEVGGALSPAQLVKARKAVETWQSSSLAAEANTVASPPAEWGHRASGLSAADRQILVMTIQKLLTEQGYDPGPADGLEGPKTEKAVRAFQRNIGLDESGAISNDLVAALANPSS